MKLVKLCLLFCSVIALGMIAVSAQSSTGWSGNVDFWEDVVANNITATDNDKIASIYWNGKETTESFKLWLTVRSVTNDNVTTKQQFTYLFPKNITSYAISGRTYKLVAARENIFDFSTYCSGTWAP